MVSNENIDTTKENSVVKAEEEEGGKRISLRFMIFVVILTLVCISVIYFYFASYSDELNDQIRELQGTNEELSSERDELSGEVTTLKSRIAILTEEGEVATIECESKELGIKFNLPEGSVCETETAEAGAIKTFDVKVATDYFYMIISNAGRGLPCTTDCEYSDFYEHNTITIPRVNNSIFATFSDHMVDNALVWLDIDYPGRKVGKDFPDVAYDQLDLIFDSMVITPVE